MRVLFLTHYFPPEGNAPATRVHELCRRWVAAGIEVTVITGVPNVPSGVVYDGYVNRWYQRETIDGIDVRRVWTYLAANKGTLRRILNFVSFMLTATVASCFTRRPDLVIATSPQFFCGWAGVFASRLRRAPLVLEIRDLWPESIAAVGAITRPRVLGALEWLEKKMYAAAVQIVTVGRGYQEQLVARGVPADRIEIVPNGVDRGLFRECGAGAELRRELHLGSAFVCAYVGTIGMGSGLSVVLRAARRLRDQGRDDVVFLLVGDGAVREELEDEARQDGLSQVVFTGRLPKSRMPEVLSAADACLIHLARNELFRTVLPSKIFEAAAMGRPIVLGVAGHAAEIVSEADAGLCIEPESDEELVDAISTLAADAELAARLGRNGREKIASVYDYDPLAAEYARVLTRVMETAA